MVGKCIREIILRAEPDGYLKKRKFVAVSLADNSTHQLDRFSRHELEPSDKIPAGGVSQMALILDLQWY